MSSSEGKYGSVVPGSNKLISAMNRYCGCVILRATILTISHYSMDLIPVNHKYHMRALIITLMALMLASCKPDLPKLAADNLRGTVEIFNIPAGDSKDAKDDPEGGGLGTGFFVEDNLIVTNAHVVAGAAKIKVLGYRDGKLYDARLIAADKNADIAIIKLDDWEDFKSNAKPKILSWADSREIRVGETVWSMGNPYGLSWTVAQGLVSHKLRQAKRDGGFYMQTTTQIYPGNSGGPLLNDDGNVIAINSAIVGKEGYFGMSIPSDYARKVVSDLKEYGKINRARMGIRLDDSDDEHGVKVRSIEADSFSLPAGLLPNDKISAIRTAKTKGRFIEVFEANELINETLLLSPGDKVDLKVTRDDVPRIFSFEVKAVSAP